MDDAGLAPQDVDGILEFNVGDSVPTESVAAGLGLPEINYAFVNPAGQLYAEGNTRLACVDKKTQRLVRLPKDLIDYISGLGAQDN